MKKIAAVALFFFVSINASAEPKCARFLMLNKCELYVASMIELIANPGEYSQRRVEVRGFINIEIEGFGLYLHQDDFTAGNYANAISLKIKNTKDYEDLIKCPNHSYVVIVGTFDAKNTGHMDVFKQGGLENLESCVGIRPRAVHPGKLHFDDK